MLGVMRAAKPGKVDYLLVLLLANLSGNQALTTGVRQEVILLLSFAVVSWRMLKRKQFQQKQIFFVVMVYFFVLIFQAISLNFFSLSTMAGLLVKITIAAGIVSTVVCFRVVYTRVMVWLSILSFVFYIPGIFAGIIGIRFYDYFRPLAYIVGAVPTGVNERINILVHNFMGGELFYRNAGVFWEPGAFSGYLILALLLLATSQKSLPKNVVKRWRLILVLGILSTFSTTGYLVLPFALFTFRLVAIDMTRESILKLLWLIGFIVVLTPLAFYAWNLDFIGPKITALYERAQSQGAGWQLSRFGAVLFDWEYIRERPMLGWGQNTATQFVLHPDLERFATGNGLTGFLHQMGVIGFGIFLVAFWLALARLGIKGLLRIWLLGVTLLQLNGEMFLNYPIYLSLMFLGLERGVRFHYRKIQRYAVSPIRTRINTRRYVPCKPMNRDVY